MKDLIIEVAIVLGIVAIMTIAAKIWEHEDNEK